MDIVDALTRIAVVIALVSLMAVSLSAGWIGYRMGFAEASKPKVEVECRSKCGTQVFRLEGSTCFCAAP